MAGGARANAGAGSYPPICTSSSVQVPAAQFIFNILPPGTDNGLLIGIGAVCVVFGFAVHLAGHVFLGGLR